MSGTGTTRRKLGDGLENDRTDWERLRARSDAEVAEAIRGDPDAVDPGEAWLRSVAVPPPSVAKEQLTVRFDRDMVAWFRQQGRGYQTRMNAVLRSSARTTPRLSLNPSNPLIPMILPKRFLTPILAYLSENDS